MGPHRKKLCSESSENHPACFSTKDKNTEKQANKNVVLETSIDLQYANVYNDGSYILIQWLGEKSAVVSVEDDIYDVSCIRKKEMI